MRHRLLLCALLAAALAVYLAGLDWGIPDRDGWEYDEIRPSHVRRSIEGGIASGWPLRYPPFQFHLLAPAYHLLDWLAERGALAPDTDLQLVEFRVNRLINAGMATLTVLLVYLTGRRVFDPGAALAAAALHAFSVTATYYGKVATLDVPYVFWFSLALFAYVRLLEQHRLRDYVLLAAAAAAAVSTKDQAYSLFVLAPAAILASRWRHNAARPWPRRLAVTLLDARLVAAALVAALVFVWGHNLHAQESDRGRYAEHLAFLTRTGQDFPDALPKGPAGQARLLVQGVRQLGFTLGWPGLLVCCSGLAMVAGEAKTRRSWLALAMLLLAISCYLTLLAVIRSVIDRYLMGPQLILTLFGGHCLAAAWRSERLPRAVRSLAPAAVIGWSALRAVSLDRMMRNESRYAVERWAAERDAAGERVFGLGVRRLLPRIANLRWRTAERLAPVLDEEQADWLVTNELESPGWQAQDFGDALRRHALPFALAFTCRSRPWPDLIDTDGIMTNLVYVSPDLAVFLRTRPPPPPAAE